MAAISIRNLDDDVKERLRVRAARHGRSLEAEVRQILAAASLEDEEPEHPNLAEALIEAFGEVGGVDLDIPERTDIARAPDFS